MNKTDKFRVRGMDCAEEVNALKGTVGKLTGVVNLNFNLLDGIMTVEYDPGLLSDEAIMRSIRDAGLDAEVLGTSQPSIPDDTQSSWWDKHISRLALISSALVIPTYFLPPPVY